MDKIDEKLRKGDKSAKSKKVWIKIIIYFK